MKGENIQKLLDFTFLKFTSVAFQGDLIAIACEGNYRRKPKTMAKKKKNYIEIHLKIIFFLFLGKANDFLYPVYM